MQIGERSFILQSVYLGLVLELVRVCVGRRGKIYEPEVFDCGFNVAFCLGHVLLLLMNLLFRQHLRARPVSRPAHRGFSSTVNQPLEIVPPARKSGSSSNLFFLHRLPTSKFDVHMRPFDLTLNPNPATHLKSTTHPARLPGDACDSQSQQRICECVH